MLMRAQDIRAKVLLTKKRFLEKIASLPADFWYKFRVLPLIILFCVLQVTILDSFRIFGIKPDLVLAAVVILSFSFGGPWAIFFSLFAGMLKDIFIPEAFGINTVLFFIWSLFTAQLSRKITLDNKFVYTALIFIIVFMQGVSHRLLFIFSDRFIPLGIFFHIALFESLYSALISPLVFKSIRIILRDEFVD